MNTYSAPRRAQRTPRGRIGLDLLFVAILLVAMLMLSIPGCASTRGDQIESRITLTVPVFEGAPQQPTPAGGNLAPAVIEAQQRHATVEVNGNAATSAYKGVVWVENTLAATVNADPFTVEMGPEFVGTELDTGPEGAPVILAEDRIQTRFRMMGTGTPRAIALTFDGEDRPLITVGSADDVEAKDLTYDEQAKVWRFAELRLSASVPDSVKQEAIRQATLQFNALTAAQQQVIIETVKQRVAQNIAWSDAFVEVMQVAATFGLDALRLFYPPAAIVP